MTITSSTGHLAMFQIVTAVSPSPIALADRLGQRAADDQRRATTSASISTITSVTRICSGRSFQNGRPSSIS